MTSFADRVLDVKSRVTDADLVAKRRAQIVTAAVELFSEKGYYLTTVQEVARHAGVSAGLIYQYVRDKDDLLLLSILDVLDSYATEIPKALDGVGDTLMRWCTAFRAYCLVVDARRPATMLAYRSSKALPADRRQFVKDAEEETNQILCACVQACMSQGLFRPVNSDFITYQMILFAHAWALKNWHFRRQFDIDGYVLKGLDFFLHGLLTDKGWDKVRSSGGIEGLIPRQAHDATATTDAPALKPVKKRASKG